MWGAGWRWGEAVQARGTASAKAWRREATARKEVGGGGGASAVQARDGKAERARGGRLTKGTL